MIASSVENSEWISDGAWKLILAVWALITVSWLCIEFVRFHNNRKKER